MIEHLIINSLVIFGAFAATRDGMIFGFVAKFVTRWVLKFFLWWYDDGMPTGELAREWSMEIGGWKEDEPVLKDATEKAATSTSFITKPLFDCPPCMASVWGIPFVLLHPINIWSGVYLFALCGINYITMKLINR